MITEKSITELVEADICQYFPLQPQSLPEAFPEHNKSPAIAMLPKIGCKGLQVPCHAEHHVTPLQQLLSGHQALWSVLRLISAPNPASDVHLTHSSSAILLLSVQEEYEATGQQYIMYRPYLHALRQAIEERRVRQLLLDGMPGAGKSIAVAALAHWARQAGWVVRTESSLGRCITHVPSSYATDRGCDGASAAGRQASVTVRCSLPEEGGAFSVSPIGRRSASS